MGARSGGNAGNKGERSWDDKRFGLKRKKASQYANTIKQLGGANCGLKQGRSWCERRLG